MLKQRQAIIPKHKLLSKCLRLSAFLVKNDRIKSIAQKVNVLQQDLNEHMIVIETLKGVDSDRKCFRMVGGVLVERTVKEVRILI